MKKSKEELLVEIGEVLDEYGDEYTEQGVVAENMFYLLNDVLEYLLGQKNG